jgi:hypothetical protein
MTSLSRVSHLRSTWVLWHELQFRRTADEDAFVFSAVIWYFFAHNIFMVCIHPFGWGSALQAWRSQLQFIMVSLVFFIDIILPATLWPWDQVDLASNRNQYQEYFLGDKGSWWLGLRILPPLCANCLKIWEPQRPGTLGPVIGWCRECYTFALPLCNLLPYVNL